MILLASPEGAARAEIVVYGDLDVVTGVELRRVVGALGTATIELDLAHVTFLDCAGARTLLWADEHARRLGGTVTLVRPSGLVTRLLRLLEFDRHLLIRHCGGTADADRTAGGLT
ncbi:anti-anti-sigma factor [Streptosporangium becharense]|uniref:Anti-anti-sigma factor n=1 Tax=Streptosporangium becharense TaxID=1816182 RepID=A0A7W9MH37_9ACTN|nr:STAS domain-containing protein [Streptosporangium becharense]MBB2912404.1 anti-anti-sigma factor [Streptosporangium becharense]MBB5820767.1 anti-anti-sigma factor [Streptosporangium becharense]